MRTLLYRAAAAALILALAPAAAAQTGAQSGAPTGVQAGAQTEAQTGAEPQARFLVAETSTPDPAGDVIDVAAASGQFTQFLAAVEAAGYEETLRGEGPFTIFAPTDAAFRQMDQREVRRLMDPRNRDELYALLAYHVVPERVTTENMDGRSVEVEAANGHRVTIDGRNGLRVNDQLVAVQDVNATNGVIQGINAVLSPPVLVASN